MRKVTSDFKNQIERDNRNYYEWVDITLKDGTVLNLTNQYKNRRCGFGYF